MKFTAGYKLSLPWHELLTEHTSRSPLFETTKAPTKRDKKNKLTYIHGQKRGTKCRHNYYIKSKKKKKKEATKQNKKNYETDIQSLTKSLNINI